MSNNVVYLNEGTFDTEVLNSDQLVLVDFYADWCMPCKMLSPVLEQLADSNINKLKVAKLNVDNARNLSTKYQISGIPNVIFFKNGSVVSNLIGLRSLQDLQYEVDRLA